MPRLTAVLIAVALGVGASAALAACGGSDAKLLAGDTAQEITENLDSVQQLAAEGECVDAEDAALQVSTQVDALEEIDPKLKETLQAGAEHLNDVVDTCDEEQTEETAEETLPESTEETTTDKPEKKPKETKPKKEGPEAPEEEEETTTPPTESGTTPGQGGETPGQGGETPGQSEPPSGGIGPGGEAGEG